MAASLLVFALAACDDEGGSNGNGDPDVTSDFGTTDSADDAEVQDGDPDAAPDAAGDGGGDAEGDGDVEEGDVVADAAGDAAGDLPGEDVADAGEDTSDATDAVEEPDIPPSPYEFCPYETPATDVDCAAVCSAVTTCGGDGPGCEQNCEGAEPVLSTAAATDLESCIADTTCDDLPEGTDLGQFCFVSIIEGATATTEVEALCAELDSAADACEGEESGFEGVCLRVAPIMRPEALLQVEECADAECVYFFDCVEAAFCDLI